MAEARRITGDGRRTSIDQSHAARSRRSGDRFVLIVLTLFSCLAIVVIGLAIVRSRASRIESRALASPSPATPGEFRVMRVVDGDTVKIIGLDNIELTLRLAGIDAPEREQPHGSDATLALDFLLRARVVRLVDVKQEKYGRVLANAFVGNEWIDLRMIEQGYAWAYPESATTELLAAEAKARHRRQGLWSDESPTPPWEWRRGHK